MQLIISQMCLLISLSCLGEEGNLNILIKTSRLIQISIFINFPGLILFSFPDPPIAPCMGGGGVKRIYIYNISSRSPILQVIVRP